MTDGTDEDRRGFRGRRRGSSLLEFGLLLGLVSVVAVGSLSGLGSKLGSMFASSANELSSFSGASTSGSPASLPILSNDGLAMTVRPGAAAGTALGALTASDPQGGSLSWIASGLPSWASISSSGAVSVASGHSVPLVSSDLTTSFSASVSNSVGATAGSYSIVVRNGSPVFVQGAGTTVASVRPLQPNGALTTLAATDSDGDAIGWSSSGLPSWASLSSGGVLSVISSPPTTAATQTFPFTAILSDGMGGSVSRGFVLAETNSSPLISTTSLPQATTGSSYSQSLSATDSDGDALSWSSSGPLPSGVALSSSGLLSGTPTASGTFPFAADVSDGRGGSAQFSLSLVVVQGGVTLSYASSRNAVNARTDALATGWDGTTPIAVSISIASGTVIGSTSTSVPALSISGFPVGSTVTLVNAGRIQGAGGKGGDTDVEWNFTNGGPALSLGQSVSITNDGGLWGGGGGGQGSMNGTQWVDENTVYFYPGCGGGGGAGTVPGVGGAKSSDTAAGDTHGGSGTATAGGLAGQGSCGTGNSSPGGDPGQAAPIGGQAGASVVGSGYAVWVRTGDRRGPLQ